MSKNKTNIKGIEVAVPFFTSKAERIVIFERLEEALIIIEKYSPVCFSNMQNDVDKILVRGDQTYHGQYYKNTKLIELYETYVRSSATTTEEISSILVHEAQHGRLFRLGYGYEEEVRERIERICFRSELKFGNRIPNGEKVIKKAQKWLNSDMKNIFSTYERQLARMEALRKLGTPNWIVKIIEILVLRNTKKID